MIVNKSNQRKTEPFDSEMEHNIIKDQGTVLFELCNNSYRTYSYKSTVQGLLWQQFHHYSLNYYFEGAGVSRGCFLSVNFINAIKTNPHHCEYLSEGDYASQTSCKLNNCIYSLYTLFQIEFNVEDLWQQYPFIIQFIHLSS